MDQPLKTSARALIAGCGDIGLRLARRLLQQEAGEVTALLRDREKGAAFTALGARVAWMDLDAPENVGDWPLLFWLAPPPAQGEGDSRLRGWLAAQRGHIARVVLISTSGVYGDCGGRWIDETEPLKPQSARARRRVDAESALQAWCSARGSAAVILRVPGIYGAGRLPVQRLARGMTVVAPEAAPWSNRIHAEDLVTALMLAGARAPAGRVYNVSDGHPSSISDYFVQCARALGLPLPQFVDMAGARTQMSAEMLSYLAESRRLKTGRIQAELGFVPQFGDLAHGLAASLTAE
ncbi:SDR family oxidoreductase [Sinimarinibacterium sp. NLF-5-8]|uniref:SDR family oxidoreductase n=1 Tax=Sinimarinibacterium sp. NLF-5-8 TaxID=2698684 RepID=UPI00137C02E4|nr:SDR family oxidoreductase [Sinimarinibacterium sp. NLF-5-8]QHS09284.1 SDR family oxidoreductase [Sinimarinibacterium sp. NLF-5-8]